MTTELMETERQEESSGGGQGGMIAVASARAAQEIQAAMVIAKKFPRNSAKAYQRIMDACKRPSLADRALYEYPRGKGEDGKANFVTGPSIRMAEVLAQNWGNLDFGIIELEQKLGESTVMAYAWDLESNARQTKVFTVRHIRHTRKGDYGLTDPRDIYELTANQGARRLRACILGVIPGDIVEDAVAECEKTLTSKNASEPIKDRARKMLAAFEDLDVTQEMIEKNLRHSVDDVTERELLRLRKIFRTLKDGIANVGDYFEGAGEGDAAPAGGKSKLAERMAEKSEDKAAADKTPAEAKQEKAETPEPEKKSEPEKLQSLTPIGRSIEAWDRWVATAREAAEVFGLDSKQFDNGLKKSLLKRGLVGKGEQTTDADRADMMQAIKERRGHFA